MMAAAATIESGWSRRGMKCPRSVVRGPRDKGRHAGRYGAATRLPPESSRPQPGSAGCKRADELPTFWKRCLRTATRHAPAAHDHFLNAGVRRHALGVDVVLLGGLQASMPEQVRGDADLLG